MNELQALVTGLIAGSLVKQEAVDIEVEPRVDAEGNYKPQILVTGRKSGQQLLVAVIDIDGVES